MVSFIALVFAATVVIALPWTNGWGGTDLRIFLDAAAGDPWGYYYAPWGLHLFELLSPLPFNVIWSAIGLLNVAGLAFAAYHFGGSIPVVVTSYAIGFSFFYGQPDGLWALGFGLMMWKRNNPWLLALGLFIVSAKFYIGIPIGLAILWCSAPRGAAIKAAMIWAAAMIGSLFVYGLWPLGILERALTIAPSDAIAIDLWQYTGPIVLLLWLPVLFTKDLKLWIATWALTTPYIHAHGLTHLLVALGPIGLIGNIGYLVGFDRLILLQVLPASIYVYALIQMLRPAFSSGIPEWLSHPAGSRLPYRPTRPQQTSPATPQARGR